MQGKSEGTDETVPESYQQTGDDSSLDAQARKTVDDVKDRARETGQKLSEQAGEAGQKLNEQAQASRESAAAGLGGAAQKLRERASEEQGVAAETEAKIADAMDNTATYLKEHDTREMIDDLERYIKQHPMQAVGGAIAAGFIIGRILK